VRYLLVGGTRQRDFGGIHFEPRKVLKNAQTPTSQVHAVLGALTERTTPSPEEKTTTMLTKLLHVTETFSNDKKHDLPEYLPSSHQG
jgi:hypothetical protein